MHGEGGTGQDKIETMKRLCLGTGKSTLRSRRLQGAHVAADERGFQPRGVSVMITSGDTLGILLFIRECIYFPNVTSFHPLKYTMQRIKLTPRAHME